MTKKHLQFCIYYMQTGDPQVAYKMTYPRAAVKSLGAASSRLMARPDVAEWVNGTEERVHNRMMRQFHNEHYDEFKEKLLTINEKRTVLTKIIKGETKRVRYVKVKYGVQKVEEDLSADTVLRAIDLDTRLENFYNYLTRSDTWRKTQNIYVNTPTLQQQVNILINQTTEKEENKDAQEHVLSHAACPDDFGSGGVTPVTGVGQSHGTPTQDTPEPIIASPLQGDRGSLALAKLKEQNTPHKKAPRYLTKVNKMHNQNSARKTSNASVPAPHPHETNAQPAQEGNITLLPVPGGVWGGAGRIDDSRAYNHKRKTSTS